MSDADVEIRECTTVEDLAGCVRLQREVFNLPEVEISPVRHFIITRHAGGFTLGAFSGGKLVGFVLSVLAFKGNEKIYYSHMTAIDPKFQNYGIGTRLKWSQRKRAIEEGVDYIKWTFQPVQARNAFFNLEKLGAVVRNYEPNFYGTDYGAAAGESAGPGIESDRLFAEWHLSSERVNRLSTGKEHALADQVAARINTVNDWNSLLENDPRAAISEQFRIREEFIQAFARDLICRGFVRDQHHPHFLLYDK